MVGALKAVERLIEVIVLVLYTCAHPPQVAHDDYTSVLANYYRKGLRVTMNIVHRDMSRAAKAIGQMSCIGSTITAECVAFDMQNALEWLQVSKTYRG